MKYGVPSLTIELGTVLEAVVLDQGKRTTVHEWRGMRLLSDHDAFDRARPKLYLVRGKRIAVKSAPVSQRALDRGADDYERWNRRAADKLYELVTRLALHRHGRMVRLDYRSDKWGRKGRTVEYTHDFLEDGGTAPIVYTDTKSLARAHTVVCLGGSMTITEGGIA